MRPFRLTALVMGAALSVSVAPFAGHPVLADSVESLQVVPGNGDPGCGPDDIVVEPNPSARSEGACPERSIETDETSRARAYLIETATPGYTMTRQGPERAIGRLHPEFVKRLATAIAEARGAGPAIRRNFLGLPATCLRYRWLRRQIPFAPYLWTRRRC